MSSTGVGIPVKLMHEAIGHVVTIELKSGQQYRGELSEAEDNWNCQVRDVTVTDKNGRASSMQHVFLRGSSIRFFVIPDMLKNAPMFKRIDPKYKTKAVPMGLGGRGRAAGARGPPAAGR